MQEIALGYGLSVSSPEAAVAALRTHGIALDGDLRAPLTESDVVAIGKSLGFTVSTSRPRAPLSHGRASAVAALFRGELDGRPQPLVTPDNQGGIPNENSNNGKGKKKGHKSESEPLDDN